MLNLYPKNVPNWERVIRIGLGVFFVIVALALDPPFGLPAPLWMGFCLFNAAFVVATGFYGWCPACALLGRKIKQQKTTKES